MFVGEVVCFVGFGALIENCITIYQHEFKCEIVYLCTGKTLMDAAERNLQIIHIDNKLGFIDHIYRLNKNTLVFSIQNKYYFSESMLKKQELFVINYHPAILPDYRGVNPHTWVIFNQEKRAGITWHRVIQEIDKGPIIYEEQFSIGNDISAIQLLDMTRRVAQSSFSKVIQFLNSQSKEMVIQNTIGNYYSLKDIPNKGLLDPAWDFYKMSAFLRALDYGYMPVFSKPKILLNNNEYLITKYRIQNINESHVVGDSSWYIIKHEEGYILLKLIERLKKYEG